MLFHTRNSHMHPFRGSCPCRTILPCHSCWIFLQIDSKTWLKVILHAKHHLAMALHGHGKMLSLYAIRVRTTPYSCNNIADYLSCPPPSYARSGEVQDVHKTQTCIVRDASIKPYRSKIVNKILESKRYICTESFYPT